MIEILLRAVGLQHRSFDQVAADLKAPASQLLALFNKAMHKLSNFCNKLLVSQVEEEDDQDTAAATASGSAARKPLKSGEVMAGGKFVKESLKAEQRAEAKKIGAGLDAQKNELLSSLMKDEFAVAAKAEDFNEALGGRDPTSGSISVNRKREGAHKDKYDSGFVHDKAKHGGGKKQK